MAEGAVGVGIDVEELAALGHLPEEAILRAARRWLGTGERAWCARQRSFAEALVVVFCCKEAAWKAGIGGGSVAEVRLGLDGSTEQGRGAVVGGPMPARVEWRRWGARVVALAVAGAGAPTLDTGLLEASGGFGIGPP